MTAAQAQFRGKVAVVTGGTQGLGEAIARLFAERGAKGIVICGRNVQNGKAVAAALAKAGCCAEYVQADLADLDQTRAVTAAADRVFGRVNVLVNAAGVTDRGTVFDTSPALFERMMAVNLRAVLPHAGCGQDHAAGEDRRHDREHPVDVGAGRAAISHGL